MKDTIKMALIMVCFVAVMGLCGKFEHEYKRDATIISEKNGIVEAKDTCGNVWEFYEENNGDYEAGTAVVLHMHDNFTDSIDDDIIDKVTIKK